MAFDQLFNIYITGEYGFGNMINQTTLPTWGNTEVLFVKLCEGATAVNDFSFENEFVNIYPNPVETFITIHPANNKSLSVLNLLGEVVLQKTISGMEENLQLDVSFLSPGIYFVRVGGESRKFIKQ